MNKHEDNNLTLDEAADRVADFHQAVKAAEAAEKGNAHEDRKKKIVAPGENKSRQQRRREERDRNEGKAPPGWSKVNAPKFHGNGDGWFRELDRCYRRDDYGMVVMVRTITNSWGTMEHVVIKDAGDKDVPWRMKQVVKNLFFGPERLAVEVFPAENDLVDAAPLYHLWVLPEGMKLPFGLHF